MKNTVVLIICGFIVLAGIVYSCEEDKDSVTPTVTTNSVSAITQTTASSGGDVSNDGGSTVSVRGVCWSTDQKPTTTDNKTSDGSGKGSFTSSLTQLTPATLYYVRAYATNDAGTAYGNEVTFTTAESLTDIDGNVYETINIGTQTWMAEPLKTSSFNNGTGIPLIDDATEWSNLTTPGYCFYDNDEASYGDTYGAMYNWYAVETRDLCPDGWRVPTDDDWEILFDHLGGLTSGGKLKETGTTHWESPNTGATNETGFTALPGGYRMITGVYVNLGRYGHWWSASPTDATHAWYRYVSYNDDYLHRANFSKKIGFTIRCIKD